MKKIGLLFIALAFALIIPFSSANAAGNGSWDSLDSSPFYYNSSFDWWDTANFSSTGGDIKLSTDSWFIDKVEVWEYDPGSGNDDYVGLAHFSGKWQPDYLRNINRFVDGSNHRAEFYVRTYSDHSGSKIYFWD